MIMLMYTQPFWHISADPCFLGGGLQRCDEVFIVWLLYQPTCSCGCCIGHFFCFAAAALRSCVSADVWLLYRPTCSCVSADVWLLYRPTFFHNRFDGLGILRVRGSEIMPRSLFIVCSQPTPGRQTSRRELSHYSQLPYYLREFADSEHARILGKGRLFVPIICLLIYLLTYLFNSLLVFCLLFIYLLT